jgi:hypothetical protein
MKVALIGSAPSSTNLAPYWDKTYRDFLEGKEQMAPPLIHGNEKWDIWGCSPGAAGQVGRATRWFEVHRWEPGKDWFQTGYLEFLRRFKGAVYIGGAVPPDDIPMQRRYPIKRVEEEFSSYFLTSSLSLMMALAILEIDQIRKARKAYQATLQSTEAEKMAIAQANPLPEFVSLDELTKADEEDEIGFWGVDMAATEEYGYQRAGCQFFILEALRHGISVYVPPESCLLRPMPVYGICEWDHNYIKMTQRMRELNARLHQHQQEASNAQAAIHHVQGGIEDLNYNVNTWTSRYGLPAGVSMRLKPGTGLGGAAEPEPEGLTKPT